MDWSASSAHRPLHDPEQAEHRDAALEPQGDLLSSSANTANVLGQPFEIRSGMRIAGGVAQEIRIVTSVLLDAKRTLRAGGQTSLSQ